jgi:hypothetical protein
MTDKMKGLLNTAKKLATLTNFLIITIVCILVYFIYQLVKKCNFNDPIQEGFVAQKELTDLLDKLRVKLYEKESVWSNELFNQQPDRKEKSASFWEPKNETGQPFKRVGQCVSVEENYDMPSDNTMLLDGDVKPPTDAKFLFQFPGNIISRNETDSSNYNVYTGIRSLKDIEDRLNELNDIYQKLIDHKDNQIVSINNIIETLKEDINIKLYGKYDYFQNNPLIKFNSSKFNIPNNKYGSISFPVGSKLTLQSEHSDEKWDIDIPIDIVYDSSGNLRELDLQLYSDVTENLQLDGNDFNVLGNYGLNAVNSFDSDNLNNKDKSSQEMEFKQSVNDIYNPNFRSQQYGFFTDEVNIKFSYNYAVTKNGNHSKYGRDNIFKLIENLETEFTNNINSNKITVYNISNVDNKELTGDIYTFKNDELYNLWYRTKNLVPGSDNITNKTIQHPYITKEIYTHNINITNINNFRNNINNLKNDKYWFNIDIDDLDEINTNNNEYSIIGEMYYINLAFMFTTMRKGLKYTDVGIKYASDVNSHHQSCCEIDDITEESLSRRPYFQGYLKSGTASLNIPDNNNPVLLNAKNQKNKILAFMDNSLSQVTTMINQLENLKSDLLENRFQHFPLKIYRPIPTKNYISLGDVLFNHRNTNYNLRQPILDNIATIPKQCYKEVRDWLSVDKVYEYRDGDTYLAIFKNPYLQTFKAVTVPDTLPPGRVGKVVACVEGCRLLDDIIEADKCSKKFFKANKEIIEGTNLDPDNTITSRESTLYKNKIQDKQDRINTLKEVARRLQIQDDKANIINRQYNKQQLQNLVDSQRRNINTLVDELQDGKNRIDINVKFSYDKFQGLITVLRQNNNLPPTVADRITEIVDNSARQKLDTLPDEDVKEVLASCPTPETEGLVVKALVESGCFNCYNLR